MNKEVRLVLPFDTYQKIMGYTKIATGEITGFADVDFNPETNELIAGEVYLLEQEAGGADVEMNEEIVSQFTYEMIKSGKEQLPRLWWHSHVHMGVFFSATDDESIEYLSNNDSYLVALVVNKKEEMHCEVAFKNPLPMRIVIETDIDYDTSPLTEQLRKEVGEKVKTKTYEYAGWFKGGKDKKGEKKTDYSQYPFFEKDDEEYVNQNGIYLPSSTRNYQVLPVSRKKMQKKIKNLKLERIWSTVFQAYVYESPLGEIWVTSEDADMIGELEATKKLYGDGYGDD